MASQRQSSSQSAMMVPNRRLQIWDTVAGPANLAAEDFPSISRDTDDVAEVGPAPVSRSVAKWNRFSERRKESEEEARRFMGADGSAPSTSSPTEATDDQPDEVEVDGPSTSTARRSRSYRNGPARQRFRRPEDRETLTEREFYKRQIRLNETPVRVPTELPVFVPESSLKAPKLPKEQTLEMVEQFRRNSRFCKMAITVNGQRLSQDEMDSVRDRWSKNICDAIEEKCRVERVNGLVMALGPTACDEYMNGKLRNISCLSNSFNPLVCLKLKNNSKDQTAANDICRDLGIDKVKAESFAFSHPRVPYVMEMRHGEPIKFISTKEEQRSALVIDDLAPGADPRGYFSKKYGKNVEVCKMDSLMMKEYNRRNDIAAAPSRNAYLITFESVADKEECRAKERNFQNSDCSVVGAIDYSRTYNSVSLEVVYDSKKIRTKYAIVTLSNPNEIDFAQRALKINYLSCMFMNENNLLEEGARYRRGNKRIFVSGLPRWCNTAQLLNWYFDRILTPNKVQYEKVEFLRAPADRFRHFPTDGAEEYFLNQTPAANFRHQLIMQGGAAKLYRGSLDAMTREFDNAIKTISFQIEELPCTDPTGNEKRLAARFCDRAYHLGVQAAENLVNGMAESVKCLMFNKGEYFGPRAYPKIRKMLPISKRVRIAFDEGIREVDEIIRNRTDFLGIAANNMTSAPFTILLQTKFIEFWRDGEDEGLIGVEGWQESDVDYAIQILQSVIQPVVLDCVESNCEELLYGFGESYAKLVIDNHSPYAVADFDRFNRKISVYGSDAQKAIDEMKKFNERKPTLHVKTEILFNGAFLNNELTQFFDDRLVWNIARDLRCQIRVYEEHVEFDGALSAFEAFEAIVKAGNSQIYKKATSNLDKNLHEPRCAVCTDDVSEDFYRLEACGHVYCRPCLNGLVQNSIMERRLPCKCLFEGCGEFIAPVDIKVLLLGGEDRIKALDAQKLQKLCDRVVDGVLLDSNSLIKACPTPDCSGLFSSNRKLATDDVLRHSDIAQCFNCDKRYCQKCLAPPHLGESCTERQRLREDAEFSLEFFVKKNGMNVKRCPIETCRTVIQRNEGCNHMECTVCKNHFCWVCGYSADNSRAIYGHMHSVHGTFVGNVDE